ncbi:MAG: SMC-Scp complex subunit ScpB [Spirochaetes bacterium]|nr:SMC-Scp complex subunit ScpB [Spirochaetota bacterium]
MSVEEKKALIEALLFIENEPVPYGVICKHADITKSEMAKYMKELQDDYEVRQSGLLINEVAEGYQMIAHPRFSLILSKIYGVKNKSKLSKVSLEVLAIIAYKQPVTRAEIESVRGVSTERTIKQLLEKDLITIAGRRETVGRPIELGTTKHFLKIFNLKSVKDLPQIREIKEMEFNKTD